LSIPVGACKTICDNIVALKKSDNKLLFKTVTMSKPANMSHIRHENSQYKKDNRNNSNNRNSFGGNHQQNQHNNQNQNSKNRNEQPRPSQNDIAKKEEEPVEKTNEDKEMKPVVDGATTTTQADKKFTGRCRLFVGNLTPDTTEDEFKKLFEPYGEISEVYVNTGRGFGFIRLDYRHNAEAAKAALDGLQRKGRVLRIRFATHAAALRVKNLHPHVSNELLEQSFAQFGELERCIVIVDDRGKSTGEGIVEFVRKPGANSALRRITEGVFLMGADPKPIAVEPLEQKDEEDGMPEKFLTKTEHYKKEREKEPRFAPPGTFEYEFGMRWKQLEELEKQRIEQVKKDTEEGRLKLEDEMQNALYEYQAEQIRQDLLRQQEELRRLEELRNADRIRRQEQMEIRRQENERERAQAEERRRADMMMVMRQNDIARGRGPMDPPMRQREEMMMNDRFGDRMGDRMSERMPDRPPHPSHDRMNDRMGGQQPGYNMWQEDKARAESSPKPLMAQGPGGGGPNNPSGSDSQMRRSRFDQPGGDAAYQNQRGVLGNAPGSMGGSKGGPGSNPAAPGNQMRSGPGGMGGPTASQSMFSSPPGNMNDRMMLERRREPTREEIGDIKRMRRM